MSMFDPQSRNALAAFLAGEKDTRPYSETYQRGLFAPLGVNGYTGKAEAAIPSMLGGGGWGTLHDIMQGRAVTKDEIDSAAMELGGAAQTGGMAMPKPRGALGSGAMRETPANSLMQGAKNESQGIRAYHGSPHDFDQFSLEKIGTGEGAQAYGHGLYFAENEGVAKSYRDALSNGGGANSSPLKTYEDLANKIQSDPRYAALESNAKYGLESFLNDYSILSSARGHGGSGAGTPIPDSLEHAAELAKRGRGPFGYANGESLVEQVRPLLMDAAEGRKGRMYEVNIKADPNDFLDWDKPLSQQSEKVRQQFQNSSAWQELVRKQNDQVERLKSGGSIFSPTPERIAEFSAPLENRVAAELMQDLHLQNSTKQLREAGIPGIKYLDQGSRTAGEGSRNYVVFDEKLIEIARKYGIPLGALGLGAGGLFDTKNEQ